MRSIERKTVQQAGTPFWFAVRKYMITASMFGEVMRLRDSTHPDNLVLFKIGTSLVLQWNGVERTNHVLSRRNENVCPSGFLVSTNYPFLGATPDGAVSTHMDF